MILAHLLQTGKAVSSDSVQLTQKSLERGHDFYFLGYVHDVKVCNSESKVYVESKCWESQRKHMEYIQKFVLSEVQQSNAADEVESEEKEGVKVQLRVTYASCVSYPAGTSGGQHASACASMILRYSFSCSTMHLCLHHQHLSLAQVQSPVVRSYGGPRNEMLH